MLTMLLQDEIHTHDDSISSNRATVKPTRDVPNVSHLTITARETMGAGVTFTTFTPASPVVQRLDRLT